MYGVLGVVIGLATISGQLIGGLVISANLLGSGWRAVFWINVPIGLGALLLALRYVPESRSGAARKLDLPGVLVLSTAQQVGGALGVAVIGAVFFDSFHPASAGRAAAAGHAFAMASLGTFAIAALAAVLVFLLPRRPHPGGT